MTNLVELKPNRLLLDPNFDGYKLSLQEIPIIKRIFKPRVDRVLLGHNQYSVIHAKLFGFHNHLVGDEFDENGSVYFIDEDWNINKVYVDSLNDELIEPTKVWQIPKVRERISGDYNVSMKFVSKEILVVCDGTGFLYILQTGCRDSDDNFKSSFCDEVVGPNEGFVLMDAVVHNKQNPDLHVLLLSVKLDPCEQYISVIHWITLTFESNKWTQTSLKQMRTKGGVQYAALEKDCKAVYIASDNECNIVLNSDNPVSNDAEETNNDREMKYLYTWSQTKEDISISIELPENALKNLISVITDPLKLHIKYDNNNLLLGSLCQRIDSDLTHWEIVDNKLIISICKLETGLMWPELILGDDTGLQISDSDIITKVNQRFAQLTNEEQQVCTFNTVWIVLILATSVNIFFDDY